MLLSDGLFCQFVTGIIRLEEVWLGNSLKDGLRENQKQEEESPKSETLCNLHYINEGLYMQEQRGNSRSEGI